MNLAHVHEIVVTVIIRREDKYLLIRRALSETRFPGMWTVPGGKVESETYQVMPKDGKGYWKEIIEHTLRREAYEEVGLQIKNIQYLTSCAFIHKDGTPSTVLSCTAEYLSGDVQLQEEEIDAFQWVTSEEARDYNLLGGIYEEILLAEKRKKDNL
jgi:8-oxo-dGTP pyrophosphatase MutT (NUDIX family)